MQAAAAATNEERAIALDKTKSEIAQLQGFGVAFTEMPADERRAMQDEMAKRLYAQFVDSHPGTKPIFAAIAAARG